MSTLFDLLHTGGNFFMFPLLFMLIFILAAFVIYFIKKKNANKIRKLINTVGLFAIVWGFLGQILGLMTAFETIQMAGDISPSVLAAGIRISFYAPVFGILIFLIGKIEVFILYLMQKELN